MGIIVCQTCENMISHFETEKVSVLYGVCGGCCEQHHDSVELKEKETA